MCSFLTRLYCDLDIKGLSPEASEAIADLRDRIQETLYHVVRETHPKEVASSRFGNLLLFIPSVMMLGSVVCDNLEIVDSFGHMPDRLMHDVLQEFTADEAPVIAAVSFRHFFYLRHDG
ncbi:unnamed protein product [Heligmosomoides polygyrus]|uniref:NR LBD domain-containing protein n=1 Tax=Heligmosomoides polygyrus TaxID=6339 RepID=A0A183F8J3_HELPZ|nr:unnamed protein product [Heligmosomoides polygyrus]